MKTGHPMIFRKLRIRKIQYGIEIKRNCSFILALSILISVQNISVIFDHKEHFSDNVSK